ncbi:hypothetical protein FZC66_05015 [Priestia megaterium]|nr:hypothetical protein FZC66_05015 [Priestia megaterium]
MKRQFLLIGIVTCVLFVLIFHKTIFQEGNPLPIAISMIKLKATDKKVVQISKNPERYLIHSKDYVTFIESMDKKGDVFQYQEDKLFYFNRDDKRASFVSKSYTDSYTIMELK